MHQAITALYADLGRAIGGAALQPDAAGTLTLDVGDDASVSIFAESALAVMLAAPALPLPLATDYGRALWLLRRNFHDSPIAPFHLGCDAAGMLVVWGRVPVEGLTGSGLMELARALADEVARIRAEVAVDGT